MTAHDLYSEVTRNIVTALEAGGLPPWRKPWAGGEGGFLPLRHSGQTYRGINVLILMIQSDAMGYTSPYWMTFKQAQDFGGCVRKGEKSTAILWSQPISKQETAEDGTEAESRFWVSKTYRVFNAQQIDNLPDRYTVAPVQNLDPSQRIEHADAFIKNTGADIRHGTNGAYYKPSEDFIALPSFEAFNTPEDYVATALHELQHWTGAKHRLDRDLKRFGCRLDYAREEIVAELGSVFSSADLGIAPPDMGQHAAYIEHWIRALKEDPRYLFSAASKAQASADYLRGLQPEAAR